MKSNTEGWSNQQLNDRIELLEDRLEVIRNYCLESDKRYSPNWFWSDHIKKILEELE